MNLLLIVLRMVFSVFGVCQSPMRSIRVSIDGRTEGGFPIDLRHTTNPVSEGFTHSVPLFDWSAKGLTRLVIGGTRRDFGNSQRSTCRSAPNPVRE